MAKYIVQRECFDRGVSYQPGEIADVPDGQPVPSYFVPVDAVHSEERKPMIGRAGGAGAEPAERVPPPGRSRKRIVDEIEE